MNASNDWVRLAACVVLLMPAAALAGGFHDESDAKSITEYMVTDQPDAPPAAVTVEPVDHDVIEDESVLVRQPIEAGDAGFEMAEDNGIPCDRCHAPGCISCCDDGGCTGSSRRAGWRSAAGYFNRLLGPADPRWVAQVDALMLWQGNLSSQAILTDAMGQPVLNANQAQTPMSAGPRFGLFFNLDQCYAIEGNYFNVGTFPGDAAFTPAGSYTLVNVPTPTPVASATGFDLFSTGRIQSAEMNWRRRECNYPITWLAGFRWVEWNSLLQFQDAAVPPQSGVTSITGNDLYGGQIGADLGLWNAGGRITVNGIGKAGVFYNTAYQRTYQTVQGSHLQGPVSATAEQTSFFGEVGVNGSLRLTNWLSWRAGYSLFWLSAVAVPVDQMPLTTMPAGPATINTNGSVLLHGVTTGLEARW